MDGSRRRADPVSGTSMVCDDAPWLRHRPASLERWDRDDADDSGQQSIPVSSVVYPIDIFVTFDTGADYDKRTALHLAASEGHTNIIEYLLSRHADVSPVDRTGGTPLSDAIRHKQLEAQRILAKAGASVPHDDDAAAELCRLAFEGDLDEMKILVENGLDVNLGDYDSRRALHLACCEERLGVIEYLLQIPGIDVSPVDRFGGTPLEDAIRENRHTVALLLEKHGAVRAHHPSLRGKYEHLDDVRRRRKEERGKTEAKAAWEQTNVARIADALGSIIKPLSQQNKRLQDSIQALIINTHPRNWKSKKAISHGPQIDVRDACSDVFIGSFRKYMREEEHAEHMLNCYMNCMAFGTTPSYDGLSSLLTDYIGHGARREIITVQKFVDPLQKCLDERETSILTTPPYDILKPICIELEEQLMIYLKRWLKSAQFKEVINSKQGKIWRILKLCQAVAEQTDDIVADTMAKLKSVADDNALTCIFGERSERIRTLQKALTRHVTTMKSIRKFAVDISIANKVLYERNQRRRRILGRTNMP